MEANTNNSRQLKFLYLTMLIDIVSMSIIIPLLPAIMTDQNSLSYILPSELSNYRFMIAGVVAFIFSLFQFISAPLAGKLSDKYGRKKVLIICFALLVSHYFIFALALYLKSIWIMILSRAIGGLGAANFGISQAILSDITEPKDRARVFGNIGAIFGIGFVLGPAIGAGLAKVMPMFDIFILVGFLCMANLANIIVNIKESIHELQHHIEISLSANIKSMLGILRHHAIAHLYTINILAQLSFGFITSYAGFYFEDKLGYTATNLGIYMVSVGVLIALYQGLLIRKILARSTERRSLVTALVLLIVSLAMYTQISFFYEPFLIAIFSTLGFSMASVILNAEIARQAPKEIRGEVLGLGSALQTLGMGIPSLVAGILASSLTVTAPFYLGTILAIASLYFTTKNFHVAK